MYSIRIKTAYTDGKQKEPPNDFTEGPNWFFIIGRLWHCWTKESNTRPLWADKRNPLDRWTVQRLFPTALNNSFQSHDDFLKIVYGNESSVLEEPNSIGHCICAEAQMSKGFAQLLPERNPRLKRVCRRANLMKEQTFPYWDSSTRRYIYNLVTKGKYSDKPVLSSSATKLQNM